jgi:putative ABC transport system substrate-binding protein
MATVGIMHSGSPENGLHIINSLIGQLRIDCKEPLIIDGPHWASKGPGGLLAIAQQLVQHVDLLIAAGGSESAEAAIQATGNASKPIIVFTSATSRVLNQLPKNVTGVDAHSSDCDAARLEWLVKMPLAGTRIGVLRNPDRKDAQNQKHEIDQAARHHKYTTNDKELDDASKIRVTCDQLRGTIDALLVAADPLFNKNYAEVVNAAIDNNYPAIYQWREFVEIGGLMSYGPRLRKLYVQAGKMAASILNSTTQPPSIPPVWEAQNPNDFELVVNEATARKLSMWPLLKAFDRAEVI